MRWLDGRLEMSYMQAPRVTLTALILLNSLIVALRTAFDHRQSEGHETFRVGCKKCSNSIEQQPSSLRKGWFFSDRDGDHGGYDGDDIKPSLFAIND